MTQSKTLKRQRTVDTEPRSRKKTKTKVDITTLLRERIAKGEMPPGTKLNESDLAAEFGVPRTRLRDAFMDLEQRGLIERTPNRGAMVARLEPEQVFRIYDVREVLEGLCARLATENSTPAQWKDLLTQFSGPVREAVQQGDFETYTKTYDLFRQQCIELADNSELTRALDNIYEKTQVLIRRTAILPGRAERGVIQHCAVLQAMYEGNAEKAEALRRENIRDAKACLNQYIKYVL